MDAILYAYIEEDLGQADIIAKGFDKEVVEKVIRLVDRNEYKRRRVRELLLVHLVANDVIRLSTVGQRMTEQKNSSKLQHLLKHFCLSRWNFSKTIIYRKLTYLFPAIYSAFYTTCR